jgi:hypothetical protein
MVQYTNKEYRRSKNQEPSEPDESNEDAIAWAKQNQEDAHTKTNHIKVRSREIREIDLQLQAEAQAEKMVNMTTANALNAILKWERGPGIFSLLCQWINRPQNGSLDELLTLDDPLDIENTTWTVIVEKQAILKALIKNGQ